jgi:hypothetical protein
VNRAHDVRHAHTFGAHDARAPIIEIELAGVIVRVSPDVDAQQLHIVLLADPAPTRQTSPSASAGRGWDRDYSPPLAQIRTCGTIAYGSCLES